MTATNYQSKRTDFVNTPEMRIAYPYVHEKSAKRANGQPRTPHCYIITGILPKLHQDPMQDANYLFLAQMVMEAVAKEPSWNGQYPGPHWPIRDGDAPPKQRQMIPGQQAPVIDPTKGAWRKGCWTFEAKSYFDPGPHVFVMQDGKRREIRAKVVDGKQMYKGGDYAIVSLNAWTYVNESAGVNFGFDGVLFTKEGEAIGSSGQRSAAQMFANVAPMGAPVMPGMPMPGAGGFAPPVMPPMQQQQPQMMPPAAPPMPGQGYAPPAAPPPQQQQAYAPPPAMPGMPPMPPAAPAGVPPLPPMPGMPPR